MASRVGQDVSIPDKSPSGVFVVPQVDPVSKVVSWLPASGWEIPVWGWVVINHVNYSIQIFLPDGSFYQEVQLKPDDSSGRATTSDEWLPFRPPAGQSQFEKPGCQLQRLVQQLSDRNYLQQFFDMINDVTSSMKPSSDAYAEFNNALIGRPVALVNAGWSLEPTTDAHGAQTDKMLPKESKILHRNPNDQEERVLHSFPFRLSDLQRGFDGLVGFFNLRENATEGDALELGTIYSHFACQKAVPKSGSMVLHGVVDARTYFETNPSTKGDSKVDVDMYAEQRNRHLDVFGLILDPFSAVQVNSATAPVKELERSGWTWETATNKIKTFFHMGPLITTRDVPDFDGKRNLVSHKPPVAPGNEGKGNIKFPDVPGGDWAWLQPYTEEEGEGPDPFNRLSGSLKKLDKPEESEIAMEKFMPLAVEVETARDEFEPGPYTALEGYLMMNERLKEEERLRK